MLFWWNDFLETKYFTWAVSLFLILLVTGYFLCRDIGRASAFQKEGIETDAVVTEIVKEKKTRKHLVVPQSYI